MLRVLSLYDVVVLDAAVAAGVVVAVVFPLALGGSVRAAGDFACEIVFLCGDHCDSLIPTGSHATHALL